MGLRVGPLNSWAKLGFLTLVRINSPNSASEVTVLGA